MGKNVEKGVNMDFGGVNKARKVIARKSQRTKSGDE